MKTLLAPLGSKPLKMAALIVLAMVAVRVAGEFGTGFVEGLVAELTN